MLLSAGRSVRQGTEGKVGFPISEAASCEGGLAASPLHHTRNKVLIACPLPTAAVLAQGFAALNVLVLGLQI